MNEGLYTGTSFTTELNAAITSVATNVVKATCNSSTTTMNISIPSNPNPYIEIFTEESPSVVRRKLALSFIETLAYAYSSNVITPVTLLVNIKVEILFPLALII